MFYLNETVEVGPMPKGSKLAHLAGSKARYVCKSPRGDGHLVELYDDDGVTVLPGLVKVSSVRKWTKD